MSLTETGAPPLGWETFPPTLQDCQRLARYKRYEQLFDPPEEVKDRFSYLGARLFGNGNQRRKIEILADYPGVITRVCADLLCGEPPVIQISGGDKDEQGLLDQILTQNDLNTVLYESQLAASSLGDAVFRARWGLRHPEDTEPEVVIEEIPAENYFVDHDPDNIRRVRAQHVAWVREIGKDAFLRVETHLPGEIFQRLYTLKGENLAAKSDPLAVRTYKIIEEIDLSALYSEAELATDVQPYVKTGVSSPLLFHIPNYRTGKRYWGIGDYDKLEPIFGAINNRMSKIDQYLDRHSAPKLVTPPGLLGPDGKVNAEALETIITSNPEIGKFLPRYVTWDGQMNSSFQQLEVYVDLVFKVSEIAPAVFGLDKAGSIESGRAMRMRFVRTEAKINRKRTHYDRVVKRLLATAIALHQFWYPADTRVVTATVDGRVVPVESTEAPPALKIDISWQDGIPQDYAAAVTSEVERVGAGLTSRKSAIKRVDGVSDDQAEAELQLILGEQKQGFAPGPAPPAPQKPALPPAPASNGSQGSVASTA
jgi:hypothetical protein